MVQSSEAAVVAEDAVVLAPVAAEHNTRVAFSSSLVKLLLTRVIMLLLKRLTLSAVHALGR